MDGGSTKKLINNLMHDVPSSILHFMYIEIELNLNIKRCKWLFILTSSYKKRLVYNANMELFPIFEFKVCRKHKRLFQTFCVCVKLVFNLIIVVHRTTSSEYVSITTHLFLNIHLIDLLNEWKFTRASRNANICGFVIAVHCIAHTAYTV